MHVDTVKWKMCLPQSVRPIRDMNEFILYSSTSMICADLRHAGVGGGGRGATPAVVHNHGALGEQPRVRQRALQLIDVFCGVF